MERPATLTFASDFWWASLLFTSLGSLFCFTSSQLILFASPTHVHVFVCVRERGGGRGDGVVSNTYNVAVTTNS